MRFIKLLSLIGAMVLLGLITACGGDTPEREPQATEIQVGDMLQLSRARMQVNATENWVIIFTGRWNVHIGNLAQLQQTIGEWVAMPNVTVRAEQGMFFDATGLFPISYTTWRNELGGLPLGGNNWITTRGDEPRIPGARQLTPADNLSITNANQLADIVTMVSDFGRDNPGQRASVTFDEQVNTPIANRGLNISNEHVPNLLIIAQNANVTNPFIRASEPNVVVTHEVLSQFEIVGTMPFNNGNKFKTTWTADVSEFNLNGQRLRTSATFPLADKDPTWISDAVTVGDGMTNSQKLLPWHGWGNYGHQIEIRSVTQGGQIWLSHLTDETMGLFATPAAEHAAPFLTATNPRLGRHIPMGTSPTAEDWYGATDIRHWSNMTGGWAVQKKTADKLQTPGYQALINVYQPQIGMTADITYHGPTRYAHVSTLVSAAGILPYIYPRNSARTRLRHVIDFWPGSPWTVIAALPDGMTDLEAATKIDDSGWSRRAWQSRQLSSLSPENVH